MSRGAEWKRNLDPFPEEKDAKKNIVSFPTQEIITLLDANPNANPSAKPSATMNQPARR